MGFDKYMIQVIYSIPQHKYALLAVCHVYCSLLSEHFNQRFKVETGAIVEMPIANETTRIIRVK